MKDAQAAVDAVKNVGKVGIVGYCWGGFVAWMASAKLTACPPRCPTTAAASSTTSTSSPKCR